MLRNPQKAKDALVSWIRTYMNADGGEETHRVAVLGLSGGKDSTVAAALCAEAIGKDRVCGLIMPQQVVGISDAHRISSFLGINGEFHDIGDVVQSIERSFGFSKVALKSAMKANIPSRVRMVMLYTKAQEIGNARVVNTTNRSEKYLGWCSKFGDGAGDFAPLADLLNHEVVQIGHALGIPEQWIEKEPADGDLRVTDAERWGFDYDVLDRYIDAQDREIDGYARDFIDARHYATQHKYAPMPTFMVGANNVERVAQYSAADITNRWER